jgi:hypothetical protein
MSCLARADVAIIDCTKVHKSEATQSEIKWASYLRDKLGHPRIHLYCSPDNLAARDFLTNTLKIDTSSLRVDGGDYLEL